MLGRSRRASSSEGFVGTGRIYMQRPRVCRVIPRGRRLRRGAARHVRVAEMFQMLTTLQPIAAIALAALLLAPPALADEVELSQTQDAAKLYRAALDEVHTDSPAASSLEYPGYPPFGEAWDRMAEASRRENAGVFPLVR